MLPTRDVVAWLQPAQGNSVVAAFVAKDTMRERHPATRLCTSTDEGRRWVETEAAAVGAQVEWVTEPVAH